MGQRLPNPPNIGQPTQKKVCEYCNSSEDGLESQYHPGTCGHCGAELSTVFTYCHFYGQPITDIDTFIAILEGNLQREILKEFNHGNR